jgi:hypothetical protein
MSHTPYFLRSAVVLASLTLAVALVPGATEPICEPNGPGEVFCLTDADCGGLAPAVNCVGDWWCEEAECVFHCSATTACALDTDCAEWETCVVPLVFGDDGTPTQCVIGVPPCGTGVCALKDGSCWTDGDCANEEACEGAIVCPPGALCLMADRAGTCAAGCTDAEVCDNGLDDDCDGLVDEGCETGCTSDGQCGYGQFCELQTICPPCAMAAPPCEMPCHLVGICVGAAGNL